MRLRSFTPRQPITDVTRTAKEWKPDPEVIIKYDGFYARAWESEYETPILDNGQLELDSDNSFEITVRHDLPNDETCTLPWTIQEDAPEIFPHTEEISDGTDTDHYTESDAEAGSEQLSPSNFNPRSANSDLRHNPKPNSNDDYRYWKKIGPGMVAGTTTYTIRWFWKSAMERLRSTYVPAHRLPAITSGTA